MVLRKANIVFGFSVLFLSAAVGGMALGGTFDAQSVRDGDHVLGLARFYLRAGHTHGNFICFFNLFVGLILNHLALSEMMKKVASYAAMVAIVLPIGLAAKGMAGAPADYPPIGVIGILGFAVATVILIIGSLKMRATE